MKQSTDGYANNYVRQMDILLEDTDELEIRLYSSASKLRNLAVDVNGITILRIGGLKQIPEIRDER